MADDTEKNRHPATVNIKNAKTGEVKTVHPDVRNMVWGQGDDNQQPLADIPPMVKSVSGVPRVMQQGGEEAMRGREDWYNSKVEEMRQVRDKLRAARRLAAESEQKASKGAQGAGAFGRKGMVQAQVQPSRVRRNHPPPDRPQPRPSTAGKKKGPQTDGLWHKEDVDWRVDGDPPPIEPFRSGDLDRVRSPTGGALDRRSPGKPRWSVPQRGLFDNERITEQERQFQKERQAQRPRTERAIEDDEFDQQERMRRSKQPWWERDDGENGPGARKPRPLSAGTGTGGGLTRGRFFGPGRDAVEQRKSPQKGGFFQYPPPPRSPDKGRRSTGAELLQGAQEEVYEGRRKSLGMMRQHKMANKAGRAMNQMAGGGAQKSAQQMEEEERAMQEKRMREAQKQQQQQRRRRGGGGGAEEEEMWHELGVEKKFGPGILRILKALAKEQQEGRDGGDGTLDQHEFRTVIRAGVESASPPADPIGPATLPDIVIKELFFRMDTLGRGVLSNEQAIDYFRAYLNKGDDDFPGMSPNRAQQIEGPGEERKKERSSEAFRKKITQDKIVGSKEHGPTVVTWGDLSVMNIAPYEGTQDPPKRRGVDESGDGGDIDKTIMGRSDACDDSLHELGGMAGGHGSPVKGGGGGGGGRGGRGGRQQQEVTAAQAGEAAIAAEQTAKAARHLEKGEYNEAVIAASRAIEMCKTYHNAFFVRSQAYRSMGKLAAAVDDLGFVLAIETTHAAAHQSRGLCLIEMGRFSQAATHFSLALKHQVPRPETGTIVSLGRAYQELGQQAAAMTEYDRAIRQEPSHAYAYFCRGHCRRILGDTEGATSDFASVMKYDHEFHVPYVARASAAEKRGNWSQAEDIYTALLEHLPLSKEDEEYIRGRKDHSSRARSPSRIRPEIRVQ